MRFFFTILIAGLFFTYSSCNKNNDPTPTNPFDLKINTLVYEDGSGIVVVQATAENTAFFHIYLGDDTPDPIINEDGYYEHTYSTSGSYLIEVRAYGSNGRYLKKTKRVTVISEDPIDVGVGYSTPFSYSGMDLVWHDEFDGTSLNTDDWTYEIGTGCPNLCGWGNNELQYYRPENTTVSGGLLTIEAREEAFQGSQYTSSRLITRDKQNLKYGRVDIRALLPKGQGLWPALWMLGQNQQSVGWPKCGEIDIMEMVGGSGRENYVGGNVFWDDNGLVDQPNGYTLSSGTFADEFHVFSIIWNESEIKWYVDDELFKTFDITPASRDEFKKSFFFIFNVAVGGNWPGSPDGTTVFPTSMKVDYIRVFQES